MSIKDRINQIQQNSINWRHRVHDLPATEHNVIPDVTKIRQSLAASQEGWKDRVSEKEVPRVGSYRLQRSSTVHSGDAASRELLRSHSVRLQHTTSCFCALPPVPIVRATSKENRPTSKAFNSELKDAPRTPVPDTIKQTVTVRALEDDGLMNFFSSPTPLLESNAFEDSPLPETFTRRNEKPPPSCHAIAQARRAVRPERRKPQSIQSLAQRSNQPMEYEEIRPSSAMQLCKTTITPFQRLLNPIDPAAHVSQMAAERQSRLADAVLTGLGSTENFSEVKSSLRRLSADQPLSNIQRQLIPYKPLMLVQIKGRRHVQARLVRPSAHSLNSGDCFVLITPDAVFAWLGSLANVVEINKARELAAWIHKHRDLSFRGGDGSSTDPIIVHEESVKLTEPSDGGGNVTSALKTFWKALGYDQPQLVQVSGTLDEDELYELLIQQTNRVYEVTLEQLVPCQTYWGKPISHKLLASDKAFVFDFGSEVYLWTGAQISPEVRQAGIELVQQAYTAPYDFTSCGLNPLNPLSTHADISASATSRPNWTLVGRVTEKGETVLFKEKFTDWPDAARIGIRWNVKSRARNAESTVSAYSAIQPYSVDELYQAAFNDPAPDPVLLTLDGRFVGRGGEGCRYEDGIPRRYRIESGPLRVWHVSEFSRTELPELSHGQFCAENTYVIRWPFKVVHVGMREVHIRSAEGEANEQCAYFFWQGSRSKLTEKGAAALMTVELDEERGPQLRVTEGNEPPAFCRLFNGRMVIHFGKKATTIGPEPNVRMFLVRGEVPSEGYLLEVPPRLSSLRPQGAFLVLQYAAMSTGLSVQKAWLWCGRLTPDASLSTAHHVVNRLRASCPPELGSELKNVIEVHQTEDKIGPGELIFLLNAEDHSLTPLCVDVDRGRDAVTLWQLGFAAGQQLHARRLVYSLQPDATLTGVNVPSAFARLSDESNPLDMAKAVAERLRASTDAAIAAKQKNSENYIGFPFLMSELYETTQPALFLLVSGVRCVYVWQGWWPLHTHSRSRHLSITSQQGSVSSVYSQSDFDGDADFVEGAIADPTAESVVASSVTGSARARFAALRQAVLKTAKGLGDKVGCKAVVVYAGLEPPEFLCLFPPYDRNSEAALYHQREEGKIDGQTDPVESLLISPRSSCCYTLAELQQRPLPADLDATSLELYLDPEEFQLAFSMSKEEFDQLPSWKKVKLRKQLGLF